VARARLKAKSANLIIVNHALLLTDAAAENQLLPRYDNLIIDEAHHLEDVATEQFGSKVSAPGIYDHLRAVGQVLDDVFRVMRGLRLAPLRRQTLAEAGARAGEARSRVEPHVDRFFSLLVMLVEGLSRVDKGGIYEKTARFTPETTDNQSLTGLFTAAQNLDLAMSQLESRLADVYVATEGLLSTAVDGIETTRAKLAAVVDESKELRSKISGAMMHPAKDMVRWVSVQSTLMWNDGLRRPDRKQPCKSTLDMSSEAIAGVSLHAAPLDVAPFLSRLLFSRKETVVLTSATLSAGSSFRYIKSRLGCTPDDELILDSPFDYMSAVLLLLPEDIPAPDRPGYAESVQDAILEVAPASSGRMLALFTSHQALRITYNAIKDSLVAQGLSVLGQGVDGTPEQVLAAFRRDSQAVLLGAASLWEGVDVVGEALSVLVVTRLPFGVPVDPVFAARSSLFDDPFTEYSLPQAVLKFKQGFGRLIRSKTDRGVVIVLDRRIHSKSYGRAFLDSLPACNIRIGPVKNLSDEVSNWLSRS
jgi:DNA polymerase-3 subunit epsilon/ATP-dependent DNA helicase DinG